MISEVDNRLMILYSFGDVFKILGCLWSSQISRDCVLIAISLSNLLLAMSRSLPENFAPF